LPEKLAGQSEV